MRRSSFSGHVLTLYDWHHSSELLLFGRSLLQLIPSSTYALPLAPALSLSVVYNVSLHSMVLNLLCNALERVCFPLQLIDTLKCCPRRPSTFRRWGVTLYAGYTNPRALHYSHGHQRWDQFVIIHGITPSSSNCERSASTFTLFKVLIIGITHRMQAGEQEIDRKAGPSGALLGPRTTPYEEV